MWMFDMQAIQRSQKLPEKVLLRQEQQSCLVFSILKQYQVFVRTWPPLFLGTSRFLTKSRGARPALQTTIPHGILSPLANCTWSSQTSVIIKICSIYWRLITIWTVSKPCKIKNSNQGIKAIWEPLIDF